MGVLPAGVERISRASVRQIQPSPSPTLIHRALLRSLKQREGANDKAIKRATAPARTNNDQDFFLRGWTQIEGGKKLEFHAGDIMWCPPEHKHWHGATPTSGMTHIAIQESQNGSPVTWMEHVTDEQYLAGNDANADKK